MLYTAIDKYYDKKAKEQYKQYFPNYRVRMRGIMIPEIFAEGGALHCMSWVF